MWTFFGTKEIKGTDQAARPQLRRRRRPQGRRRHALARIPQHRRHLPGGAGHDQARQPEVFRRHSSAVTGPYNWVASSGLKDVNEVTVTLGKMDEPRLYTVRLYFAEPDKLAGRQAALRRAIQGQKTVAKRLRHRPARPAARPHAHQGIQGHRRPGPFTVQLRPSPPAEDRRRSCAAWS